ncbi:MAG TPA: glycosyltransferase family A protein [Chitinophagales bacterium]|nr:glycosyltransferase family A protein [Chitinophagales bacterium]
MNPFFSVIIPTYNRGHMLRRPVESVINQTFASWELIIVDDGSTDNTRQVVESFADPRIRYIYQPNQERSAARNTGIKNSKGQYICFLDSDDYYLPAHLESFYKKITAENFPVAMLYCDTVEDAGGRVTRIESYPVEARNAIEWVVQVTPGSPRTCVHRSILEKHRFNPSLTVGEDLDLWVRVLKEFPVIYNRDFTVAFVTHSGRTVNVGNESSYKAHLAIMEKIISEDTAGYISSAVRKKVLASAWFRLSQHYLHTGRRWKAFNSLLRSLILAPRVRAKEKIYLLLTRVILPGFGS